MRKEMLSLMIISIFLVLPFVSAGLFSSGDLTFSTSQKDYYFKTGENAIIPLHLDNSYGKQIEGLLTYTYSQQINQGGMQMSSSNSQSTSFLVEDGESTQGLNFGTSNSPSELDISLKFSYTEKESRVVNLDGIKIHFVSDENQKQNQEDKQSSSSEKETTTNQQQNSQDPLSQMQKKMNEMMNNNQQQNSQTTQQKMQNNQMGQDSSALKKQMQRQAEEQEQMKKKFQENLAKNPDFQKQNQDLMNQGYNLSSGNLNPSSNNSGDFDLQYKKQNGDSAELKGSMENGQMKNMQSLTQEDKNKMIQDLQKNKDFEKFDKDLKKEGFDQQGTEFNLEENKTNIKVNYQDKENQTQTISADVINGTIKNVQVENPIEEDYSKSYFWIWFSIILVILLIIGYYFYKKYYAGKKSQEVSPKSVIKEKPFNYRKEAKKLLDKAKILFEKKEYKDAYEKAGQSLRVYLSYKYELKKETTNDEIIRYLKDKKLDVQGIKECFDLCSLVEFAKYDANKKDFDKIIRIVEGFVVG